MVIAYRVSPHVHKPGDTLARPRGIRIAASADGACAGAEWPFHLYEVDAADVRGDGSEMRARSCRVVRVLPREEIFGPRAAEILAILDRIPHVGWGHPVVREPDGAWIGERVKEHMTALAACTDQRRVNFADVRNLYDLKMAGDDLMNPDPEVPVAYRPDLFAVIRDEPARRNARVAAGRAAARAMFDAVWDPLWSALRVFAQMPPTPLGARDLPVVREALAAACGPARDSARDAVLAVAAGGQTSPKAIEDAKRPSMLALARAIAARGEGSNEVLYTSAMFTLVIVSDRVWASTARMAAAASASAQLLVNDYDGPNPWRPLLDLWLAGGVPIVEVNGLSIVYWCCAFE